MTFTAALLIVTNRADFAADFLITRLIERDLKYFRLDADVLGSTAVTWQLDGAGERGCLALGEKELDLSSVRSVWYRRALRPGSLESVSPPFRPFAAAELRHLFEGLLNERTRWVNPLFATEAAERKLFQLRVAPACGLKVPATLISTDVAELEAFAKSGDVICKPLSQGLVEVEAEQFAIHTEAVTPDELSAAATEPFPTLLQQRVPKGRDVRVTIIGQHIFAVDVETPSRAPVDWRAAASEGITYTPCSIPQAVRAGCLALLQRLQLRYGAFDFIRTNENEWYFLEVNPAGEWAWLEVALDLPMRDAFIDLFFGEDP